MLRYARNSSNASETYPVAIVEKQSAPFLFLESLDPIYFRAFSFSVHYHSP
jgi:hypothetical protein